MSFNEFLNIGITEFNRKLSSIPKSEPLFEIIQSRVINTSKIKDKDTTDIEKDVTKAGKLVAVLVIWTALFVAYILLFVYLPLNMLDTFQRNITEITPYSDEATIHQLESDWVCMRSENEYKEIYKVINKIKQEHDLP